MNEVNRSVKLKITVLSPIHIGCGEELDPTGYVVDEKGMLNVIVLNRLIEMSGESGRKIIEDAVRQRNIGRLRAAIREVFISSGDQSCILRKADASPEFLEIYNAEIGKANVDNALVFKAFSSSMGRAFIPGSSLKGALRTGIVDLAFNKVLKEEERKLFLNDRNVEAETLKYMAVKRNGKKQPKIELDPFKKLKVRDAMLPGKSTTICMMHNKSASGKGKGIPVALEVIKAGTEFEVDVTIAEYGESAKSDYFEKKKFPLALQYWSGEVRKKAQKEYQRLKEFSGLSSGERDKLKAFYDSVEKCEGFLNRIGFGSGYDFMTVESFRNMKNPVKGKPGMGWGYSKNIVEGSLPLGFIKIQVT